MTSSSELSSSRPSRFERHPKATILGFVALFVIAGLLVTEIGLRFIGLGHPVLYEVAPEYRYRPRPNQYVHRLRGSEIRINNLGLRATRDWDSNPSNKVLFLGNSVTYGGSYVSDSELFAERSVPSATGWLPGDGGVNAWGVNNIYGLIVAKGFLPAKIYVSVLLEGDFYRGTSERPDFFRTTHPVLALIEAIPHARYQVSEKIHPQSPIELAPDAPVKAETAMARLRAIDDLLKSKGMVHLLYVSPYKRNIDARQPKDTLLARLFRKYGLNPSYLQDRPELAHLSPAALGALYHDGVHLSPHGHQVWATMLAPDISRVIDSLKRQ